ncbi:MAG TPA: helix-turn-helix transcriptional regulator [Microlunatus sp.]
MPQPPLPEQNELDVWTDGRPFSTTEQTEQREHDESHRLPKVSTKKEVREFLISRRAHISPEQFEVIRYDQDRRVPGLRRREVAELAGVSLNDYSRLERGYIRDASPSVLNAVAEVLQLSEVDRDYLFDLARTAPSPPSS